MFPYFPLKDERFRMAMGVQALESGCLIEIDEERYHQELRLKHELLHAGYQDYFSECYGQIT